MSRLESGLLGISVIGVVVVLSPFGAEALTVGRCSQLVDGVFTPVLVVENNGQKTVHQIGEDGLTRTIVFNETAALAWASGKYDTEPSGAFYDQSCTFNGSSVAGAPVVAPGGGGGGCEGGGECGGEDSGGGGEDRGG